LSASDSSPAPAASTPTTRHAVTISVKASLKISGEDLFDGSGQPGYDNNTGALQKIMKRPRQSSAQEGVYTQTTEKLGTPLDVVGTGLDQTRRTGIS